MTLAKINQNRTYAQRLGWKPTDFGGIAFDELLVNMITAKQQLYSVTVDGVAGPATYSAMLAARIALFTSHPTADKLADAGVIALSHAKRLWLRDIVDPPTGIPPASLASIDSFIRTTAGLDWSWEDLYNGNFEWCGAFASAGWAVAGARLAIRKTYFSSTYRLDRWASYKSYNGEANPKPASGPYRLIAEFDEHSTNDDVIAKFGSPRPGDIALVGGVNTAYGKHVTVVESYDAVNAVFTTIEGNCGAAGPKGDRRHGVGRATRPVGLRAGQPSTTYFLRRLVRPAPSDLV